MTYLKQESSAMSDVKRLSVNISWRVVPCVHIHDDGNSLTMTALTLQKKEDIKDGDTFLTTEEFSSFVSHPSEANASLNDTDYVSSYDNYDNLYIHYKDFPGIIKEIFDKFEVVLKIRMKMTFKFISPVNKDYNWVGFMRYNFWKPSLNLTNMIMGSMKLFDFDVIREYVTSSEYNLSPLVIIKIPESNQKPNLKECDLVILHPDPGYYCNLELKETSYTDFRANNYSDSGIVIDTEVLDLLKNSELTFENRFKVKQNTVANVSTSTE